MDNKKIGIIGLGYVGLPLCRLFLDKGHIVYGIDVDVGKIQKLQKRQSYLSDFSSNDIQGMFTKGTFYPVSSYHVIADLDVVILCVPTPIDQHANPDMTYIKSAMHNLLPYLRSNQLIVLESSTYPGTTEEVLLPMIESTGLNVGKDISLAYSPERIDPGQERFALHEIPKVVGGVTPKCTEYAKQVYETAFNRVVVVSSTKVAEMTKLLENSQRLINISFMNEMAVLCNKMGINLWEAIDAASTKPYGFTPYFPGPGIGGHCIPVDPLYLLWKAKEYNYDVKFIDLARNINDQMPHYVVQLVLGSLVRKKPLHHLKVLVIGVTYKKNVNDMRESTAKKIIEGLLAAGIDVNFHDPYITQINIKETTIRGIQLTEKNLEAHDCTLILTDHSSINYESLVACSALVVDTRNATQGVKDRKNVILI